MNKLAVVIVSLSLLCLTGCFTSTKLSYGDLKFSRFDMGWQAVEVPNASFTGTNGIRIVLSGYSKDSKDTAIAVEKMAVTIGELAKVIAPLVLALDPQKITK